MERKQLINGETIPYGAPISVLKEMIQGTQMQDFSLACEALSWRRDEEAFRLLAEQLDAKDRWRALYAFRVIYRSPYAEGLASYAIKRLQSEDETFACAALRVLVEFDLPCPEELVKNAIERYFDQLGEELCLLHRLTDTRENARYLRNLFLQAESSTQQEILADVLMERYEETRAEELYALLGSSAYGKVRKKAVELAKRNGLDFSAFRDDPDGHVRKAVVTQ